MLVKRLSLLVWAASLWLPLYLLCGLLAPPYQLSRPLPPYQLSRPLPPYQLSRPLPPYQLSWPPQPYQLARPPPPYQLARPPPPYQLSRPPPPYQLSWPPQPYQLARPPPPYQLSRLPAGDASALIDLRGFRFLINNFPCGQPSPAPGAANASTPNLQSPSSASSGSGGGAGSTGPLLLALVHSAPDNREKRAAIRSTWGGVTGAHFRVLFLLGDVGGGERQARLDAENRRHGDLVQGSFHDAYRNLTYKHAMALKWAAYHCPGARFVLKADDDTFVNAPALLSFLAREFPPWGARRLIMCRIHMHPLVQRSRRSKWRVSWLEYPHRYYPTYCGGSAILYSPDVVFLLYEEAQAGDYFWIDDVHVTGTLAARANLRHTPLGALALTRAQVAAILAGGPPPHFLFGALNMSPDAIRWLWWVVSGAH